MTHAFYCLTVNFKNFLNLTWFYLWHLISTLIIHAYKPAKCMCAHGHTHTFAWPCSSLPRLIPAILICDVLGQPQAHFYLAHRHGVSGPVPNVTFSIVLYYLKSQPTAPLRYFSLACMWACTCFSYTGPLLINACSKACLFHLRQYKPHNHKDLHQLYLLQYPPSLD